MADAAGSLDDAPAGDDPEGSINVIVWTAMRNRGISKGTNGQQFTMDITGMDFDPFVARMDEKLARDGLERTSRSASQVWPRSRSRILGRKSPPENMEDSAKSAELERRIDDDNDFNAWLQEVAISKYNVGSTDRKAFIAYCRRGDARKDRLKEIAQDVGVAVRGSIEVLKKNILGALGASTATDGSSDDSSSGSSSSSSSSSSSDDDDSDTGSGGEGEGHSKRKRATSQKSKKESKKKSKKKKKPKKKSKKKARGGDEADEDEDLWFVDCLVHVQKIRDGGKQKAGASAGEAKKAAGTQDNSDGSDSDTQEQLLLVIYAPAVKGKSGTVADSKTPVAAVFVDLVQRGLLSRVDKAVTDVYKAKSMGHDPWGKLYMKENKGARKVAEVPAVSKDLFDACKFLGLKKNEFATPTKNKATAKYKTLHIMGTAERPSQGGADDEEGGGGNSKSYSNSRKKRRSPEGGKSKQAAAKSDQEARSRALEWLSARSEAQKNMNSMHFQLYLAFLTGNAISNKQRDRIIDSDSWPDDAEDMPDWNSAQNKALHGPPPADGAHPLDSFGKAPKYEAPRAGDAEGESLAGAMHAIARGMSGAGGGGGTGGSQRGTVLEQTGAGDRRRLMVQSIRTLLDHLKGWDHLGDAWRQGDMPDSFSRRTGGDDSFNFSGDKHKISGVASAMLMDLNDLDHDPLGPFVATLHDWCCSSLPDPFSAPSSTNMPDGATLFEQFEQFGYTLYMEDNGGNWVTRTYQLWMAWYEGVGQAPSSSNRYHGYMTFNRHKDLSGGNRGGGSSRDPLYVFVERDEWFAA
jgi:hypothetical protein